MGESERLDLSFGAIDSGWLPLCISVGDERFEVEASSVLNDPLLEFAATAEALAGSGATRSEVQLWLEPETLNILFACAPESSVVRVTMRASAFSNRPADGVVTT